MAHYLWQVAYTAEAWKAQVKHPQDRAKLVEPIVSKLGGKIENVWFSFGEFDIVAVLNMPDNVAQAAFSIAAAGAGHLKAVKTTPLFDVDSGLEALKKAGELAYPAA